MRDADGPALAFVLTAMLSLAFMLMTVTVVGATWLLLASMPLRPALVVAKIAPVAVVIITRIPVVTSTPVIVPAMIFRATPAAATVVPVATPIVAVVPTARPIVEVVPAAILVETHEVHLPLVALAMAASPTVAEAPVRAPALEPLAPVAVPTLEPSTVTATPTLEPPTSTPSPTLEPATSTATPFPVVVLVPDCVCDRGDTLNCKDFSYRRDVQACLVQCQAVMSKDVHGLDWNKDGIACNDEEYLDD